MDPSLLLLHPNHKLIYETIYHLKPDSVSEIGFGAGHHLANIQKILPHIKISGCELLESQMKLALLRHPELRSSAHLCHHDITTSPAPEKADLVFTQAVIMHIQKDGRHLGALRNIFHASKKYVLLMESWSKHNFYEDIVKISREPNFPWQNIDFYINDDGKQQLLLVISNIVLEGYKKIHHNKELLKYIRSN